jgi:hypothetical protein
MQKEGLEVARRIMRGEGRRELNGGVQPTAQDCKELFSGSGGSTKRLH